MNFFKRYKTIEDVLPAFLLERETQGNARTSMAYESHVYVFLQWMEERGLRLVAMNKITDQSMADFFIYLSKDRGLDRTTIEKYLIHLRLLFQFAQKREEVTRIPFNLVVVPKHHIDKSPEVIQHDHLKILLTDIKQNDPQLYLACMIMYYCFIRPGTELRLLKIGDINMENGTIRVVQEHAKNSKRQVVTMPNQLIEICKEYGVDTADKDLYVFGNKKQFGKVPFSLNMLRYRFNRTRDRLKLPKGYKFYSFKHSGASELHLSGISMRELMDQLRHSKLDSTQHYLKCHAGIVNERIRNNFPEPILNT